MLLGGKGINAGAAGVLVRRHFQDGRFNAHSSFWFPPQPLRLRRLDDRFHGEGGDYFRPAPEAGFHKDIVNA